MRVTATVCRKSSCPIRLGHPDNRLLLRTPSFLCMLSTCKLTHRGPRRLVAAVCAVCVRLLARGGWASRVSSSSPDFLTHRQTEAGGFFAFGPTRFVLRVEKEKKRWPNTSIRKYWLPPNG